MLFFPLAHGAFGILDELLLYCLPLLALIVIISIASRRARRTKPRDRARRDPSADSIEAQHPDETQRPDSSRS